MAFNCSFKFTRLLSANDSRFLKVCWALRPVVVSKSINLGVQLTHRDTTISSNLSENNQAQNIRSCGITSPIVCLNVCKVLALYQ